MIVVAIIGILAAVAIPGFMQYIKSSKTSEAKTNVKAIADGAVSYFEAEHDFKGDGMNPQTRVYPGTPTTTAWAAADGKSVIGNNTNVGTKNDPTLKATQDELKAFEEKITKQIEDLKGELGA